MVSDTEDKENEPPSPTYSPIATKTSKPPTFTAHHTNARATSARATASTLLDSVATALDPTTRQARQETLSIQYLQNNHILQLNAQVHDATRRIDSLTAQLAESERRNHDMQQEADRVEWMSLLQKREATSSPIGRTPLQRSSRPHYRQDIYYSDGGRATRWYGGDLSDDGDDIHGLNDSPRTRHVTVLDNSPGQSPPTPTHMPESSSSGSSSSLYTSTLPPCMRDHTHDEEVNKGEEDTRSES